MVWQTPLASAAELLAWALKHDFNMRRPHVFEDDPVVLRVHGQSAGRVTILVPPSRSHKRYPHEGIN